MIMLTEKQIKEARREAMVYFHKAGLIVTPKEMEGIEVADFGFGDLLRIGLAVVVYVNTERVCAKELVMFPGQTCPEHVHPTKNGVAGKEETFRCRWGKVFLYVAGPPNTHPFLQGLDDYAPYLQVAHEVVLLPGDQYTIMPDTLHWFRAGEDGAVVSEFSTRSTDEEDIFTDPRIYRFTIIGQ
jgi:D-lyxose ketol-isomerase